MKTLNMYAKIRRENLTSARYNNKTRKRFYYAEVRIMTSTMDVDDRSDSDDDEEIVERGAFNALVVVVLMCALHKSYTLSFSFWSSTRERERKAAIETNFFSFVFNDKERIQRRETRRSTVSALVPSRFLSNRARRERLCVVVKASIDGGRWTL